MGLFDSHFFYPERQVVQTPADGGLSYEDVYFASEDGIRLNGWWVKGRTDLTWLWFHGNGGNIGSSLERLCQYHHHFGVNLFLFDYRGFGLSEGKPTEKGVYRDATGALRHLLSRPDVVPDKIVYYGHSLGGAVAVELATRHSPLGLILESTFASAQDMARMLLPKSPIHLLVRGKFNTASRINRVACPVLVTHGCYDQIVPLEQGKKLYDLAHEPKEWFEVPDGDHENLFLAGGTRYLEALAGFLSSLNETKAQF